MKTCLTAVLGSFVFLTLGTTAQAQNPYARPPNSSLPLLNLYRGGSSGPLNYQTLVRPELDAQSAIRQLQIQNQMNQQGAADLATNPGPLVTGHAAGFMTHRTYFQTLGGATAGTAAGATTAGFGTVGRAQPTGTGIR
jgi:hypothetical protein